MFPLAILDNILLVSHILLSFHLPRLMKEVAKYEKLRKYFPYCKQHHAITTTYETVYSNKPLSNKKPNAFSDNNLIILVKMM